VYFIRGATSIGDWDDLTKYKAPQTVGKTNFLGAGCGTGVTAAAVFFHISRERREGEERGGERTGGKGEKERERRREGEKEEGERKEKLTEKAQHGRLI
jgi:hypothetical protein